jgi:hypothetical protein
MDSPVEQLIDDYLSYADMAESLLLWTLGKKGVWGVLRRYGRRGVIRKRRTTEGSERVRGTYCFHGAGLRIRIRHGRTVDIDSDKSGLKRGFDEHLLWSFIEDNEQEYAKRSGCSSTAVIADTMNRLRAAGVLEKQCNMYYVRNAERWRERHSGSDGPASEC